MSDYLPEEILIEILIKLPVKSLIRLTSVCKSWRSLIRTPSFIFAHLSNTENQALLRRYDNNDKEEHYSLFQIDGNSKNGCFDIDSSMDLAFPFKTQIGYYRIVGSCDGLICLSDDLFVSILHPIIISNPSIRNHVVLHHPPIDSKEPHNVVLGFGVAGNVYKVVRLVCSRKSDDYGSIAPPQADVFSLSSGRWRRLSGIDTKLLILPFIWCQVSLEGFLHWIAYEPLSENRARSSVLTFHIADEVFDEMPLPDELAREAVTSLSLSKIGESLVVIEYIGEIGNGNPCDVWMMKEYGVKESWSRLYRIDLGLGVERVVGFFRSGEALLAFPYDLVTYNEKTKWVDHLKVCGTPRSFYFDNYKESLLLLGGCCGALDEESSRGAMEGLSLGEG